MTSRERILAVMNGRIPDRPPWQEIGFHTDIAGKVTGKKLARSNSGFHPDHDIEQYKVELDGLIEAAQIVGLDVLWLKHWDCAGFAGPKGDSYDAGTIKTADDWKKATQTAPAVRASSWYQCVDIFVEKVRQTDLAMGFETAFGFESTCAAIGFKDFCLLVHDNPDILISVLEWFVERGQQNVRDFLQYEPDLVLLGDDIAFGQGPFVSPEHFRTIFLPRMKQVADECKRPWIYHSDGNLMPVIEDLLTMGMTALHPIEPYGTMDICEVKRLYGDRLVFSGNLDMNVIGLGTTQDIEKGVRSLFETVGANGRWILSSSNSIDKGANIENVIAMGETIKTLTY